MAVMMYEIAARCEWTQRDGKTARMADTGDLPPFFVDASGPGEAIALARRVVNPCGDANAVYVRVIPMQGEVAA